MDSSHSISSSLGTDAHSLATAPASDPAATPDLVPALELGFSVVILGIGLIAGLLFSTIVNWWKW